MMNTFLILLSSTVVVKDLGSSVEDDDHYPSLKSLMLETWMELLDRLITLPPRIFSHLVTLVRRKHGDLSDLIIYYLTEGTVYDIGSRAEREDD